MKLKCKYFVILCCSIMLSFSAKSDSEKPVLEQFIFTPNKNVDETISQASVQAKTENKHLLLVFGAQWCHDSRGLAEQFSTQSMQGILAKHYVPVFVDVGYLNDTREIMQSFGYPHYFATPTVLIIDPVTKRVINADTVDIWGAAASIELAEYESYFSTIPAHQSEIDLQVNLTNYPKLADYQSEQVDKLQQHYNKLGPLLKSYKETDEQDKQAFFDVWEEVRVFRSQLQKDLKMLHEAAHNGTLEVNKGMDISS